jgi:hypothetical protein
MKTNENILQNAQDKLVWDGTNKIWSCFGAFLHKRKDGKRGKEKMGNGERERRRKGRYKKSRTMC